MLLDGPSVQGRGQLSHVADEEVVKEKVSDCLAQVRLGVRAGSRGPFLGLLLVVACEHGSVAAG